eukprot:scaffold105851_cov31-Tisochrysis_lutea.AAC.1
MSRHVADALVRGGERVFRVSPCSSLWRRFVGIEWQKVVARRTRTALVLRSSWMPQMAYFASHSSRQELDWAMVVNSGRDEQDKCQQISRFIT